MADKTRQIGSIATSTDERGTLYVLILFINNADKAAYTPTSAGKSPSEGQAGETYPVVAPGNLLPADTYIYEYHFKPVGDHWILTVMACDDDFDWGKSTGVLQSASVLNRSLSPSGEVYFDPLWFGVIPWGRHYLHKRWKVQLEDNMSNPLTPPFLYNDATVVASSDTDLVFGNAGEGAQGSAKYLHGLTPFTEASFISANVPAEYIGKTVKTVVYWVRMYQYKGTFWDYVDFVGPNPSGTWQSGITPATAYSNEAMWRAIDQVITESKKTLSGQLNNYVERKMELVPKTNGARNLRWDKNKAGGANWTW